MFIVQCIRLTLVLFPRRISRVIISLAHLFSHRSCIYADAQLLNNALKQITVREADLADIALAVGD